MYRTATALAALALVVAGLAGCDDEKASAYCSDLSADKARFQALRGGDVDGLEEAFSAMHHLAGESPAAIADDWKTLDDAVTAVTEALDEAGVSLDDIAAIQDGEIPEGVDLDRLEALGSKLAEFDGPAMDKAAAAIERHAKDECGVSLLG